MADIYQITADSGCDLSLEKCTERGVIPYKMPFTMDGKPMTDGMTEESFPASASHSGDRRVSANFTT